MKKEAQADQILNKLLDAVIEGDVESVKEGVKEAISAGVDPLKALKALEKGLTMAGEKWVKGEAFLSDMMKSADAMKAGSTLLKPKIMEKGEKVKRLGTIVIGTVFGDIHDIGKNMVATMLEMAGFEVNDIGVDVTPKAFIDKAEEARANIIALSCLLSPSLYYQKEVITYLKDMGIRDDYCVMVGGGPVTPEWAKEIGADGYGKNAAYAVEIAKALIEKGRKDIPIIKI